jgi:PAS domain S-box-containing protein
MPKSKTENIASEKKMADVFREFDWERTSLLQTSQFSPSVRTAIRLCLSMKSASLVMIGDELITIYNDAYRQILGDRHPNAFGSPVKDIWPEIWEEVHPLLNKVLKDGESLLFENRPFVISVNGHSQSFYYTFSYSPIQNDNNAVEGIFASITDTTQAVKNEEQLRELRNRQLKNLFVQAPIAMCILRGPNLIVEVANEKILELWGKPAEQMLNKPLFEGLADARDQGFEELLNGVYNTGKRVVFDEIPVNLVRKGRTENVYVKLVYEPLREENGKISAVMVLADEVTEQVINRKKIEESEARLRLAIEITKLGTWDYDPISGELNWSDECRNIYAFPAEGKVDFELFRAHIYPADKEFVENAINDSLNPQGAGTYDITYRILRYNDKSVRWIRATGKVFFNDKKQSERFIGTVIDITEQKLMEDKLRESEMRARLAVEASQMGTFDWDVPNSTFHYSDTLAKMFGYTQTSGLNQKHFSDRIHPDDREMRLAAHKAAFTSGTLFYEARMVWPDDSIHWVRLNGKVVFDEKGAASRMYGTTLDITEQRAHAENLKKEVAERTATLEEKNLSLIQSEERYHKMVEEVQDYAIILLDRNGIIQNWNKGAENIKQYKEEEIVGKHFSVFYLPEDRQSNLPERLIKHAAETGKAVQEGWRKRKDGSRFWGSITITALHDDNNEVIGFSKVTRDLTEKKIADDRLLHYTKELESQNEELEQFAYIASHDLQEPLRKILTFSEIIQKKIQDEDLAARYLAKIDSSAQRMSELIKSVLNYSKLTNDESGRVDTDLNKIVSNVKTDFELLIEEKDAQIKIMNHLPTIKGNTLQLNQLFSNLISNSLKFSDKPPVIEIGSRIVSKQKVVNSPDFLAEENYYEVTVSDNGIGFDQQYEKLIFTIFQRLHGKQHYSGTGIGLALCKKIVENHEGHIAAKGEPGKGSIFFIYFPVQVKLPQ